MGLFDRLNRVIRANLNDMISAEVLEQAIADMQEDIVQLRQAVAKAIVVQKRTEQQYNQNVTQAGQWESRARLALSKGDEELARQALERKKKFAVSAASLKPELDRQIDQVEGLKRTLIALESKVSEAKTKKEMLRSRMMKDPEQALDLEILHMQEDLIQLRQAVARAIAAQKRTEQEYSQNITQAGQWESRTKLALSKGDEDLARQALERKKSFSATATALKPQLDQQTAQVDGLKRDLIALEGRISQAKDKRDMLKARMAAVSASETITIATVNTAMAAFDRIEEKVLQIEVRSQAVTELGDVEQSLEEQFTALKSGNDLDDELAVLKAQLTGNPAGGVLHTLGQSTVDDEINAELESLRSQCQK